MVHYALISIQDGVIPARDAGIQKKKMDPSTGMTTKGLLE
ncbi:hypothetical protein wVul_1230 [Wolbachia endosymbiont of Armadillidium vulgare str. wVulC]|nr:hypothetical protein wVul_1230 [Wolbachia endosymbiont of Armadillidium vulgare str. wVulC]